MKLKESLIGLLGEFVAIQRTPDFKLSSQTNLSLNEAVREEKRKYSIRSSEKHSEKRKFFGGSLRVRSIDVDERPEPGEYAARRCSAPVSLGDPSLFEKLKSRLSLDRRSTVISEEDETEERPCSALD